MRLFHLLIPALALLPASHAVAQGAYPDRPIKMIVPLAAASAVELAGHLTSTKMASNMGQQFGIPTPPGASGLIGAEAGLGSTISTYSRALCRASSMTMVPNLQSKMR